MAADTVRLLIDCPDRPGLIALFTGAVAAAGGNVLDADQHTDPDERRFFMRLAIERASLDRTGLEEQMGALAREQAITWRLRDATPHRRAAILASREGHCLSDLLWRCAEGELEIDVALAASNHRVLEPVATAACVPFHHLPVTAETKPAQEAALLELLEAHDVELVILARYMQILSPALTERYAGRIINIHHAFLPAFPGPRPYHRAHERGVKLIGATSHYVTAALDEGPIIAQQTTPVRHRDTVEDLVRKGRNLERLVLADAVRLHAQDRVLIAGNRTVVFE